MLSEMDAMPTNDKKNNDFCCDSGSLAKPTSLCRVDAVVAIDGRGQIVLPKDIRQKAGIEAGDKLAVVSWESDGRVCCLSLIKADDFAGTLRDLLGPMMQEILQG
jgi:AbrB family looped-hinge helix DNA binding protein